MYDQLLTNREVFKWKTCKHTSMIPYVGLCMQFPNETKWIVPYSDWCKSDG